MVCDKLKKCRKCGVELIVGENWYECQSKCYNYICNECTIIKTGANQRANPERSRKYSRAYYYRNGGESMAENKTCSQFLGVHVAERVLSETFKNVERMPHGHPGYDFICNKGKKIDVKASCLNVREKRWRYFIKYNSAADYFLCLAFDNREDLNPLHAWLVPSERLQHMSHANISQNTIYKWDKYRIEIDRVVKCCDEMKRN